MTILVKINVVTEVIQSLSSNGWIIAETIWYEVFCCSRDRLVTNELCQRIIPLYSWFTVFKHVLLTVFQAKIEKCKWI